MNFKVKNTSLPFQPYLSCFINNQWSFTGGSRIYKEGDKWVVAYSSGKYSFNENDAKNITCIYAGTPKYGICFENGGSQTNFL